MRKSFLTVLAAMTLLVGCNNPTQHVNGRKIYYFPNATSPDRKAGYFDDAGLWYWIILTQSQQASMNSSGTANVSIPSYSSVTMRGTAPAKSELDEAEEAPAQTESETSTEAESGTDSAAEASSSSSDSGSSDSGGGDGGGGGGGGGE